MDYVYNRTITSSQTFTASKAGWYRFHVVGKGGSGGAGAGASASRNHASSWVQGGSGGAGATGAYSVHDAQLKAGDTVSITVNDTLTQAMINGAYVVAYAGGNGGAGGRISSTSGGRTYYGENGAAGAAGAASGGNVINLSSATGAAGSNSKGGDASTRYSSVAKYTPTSALTPKGGAVGNISNGVAGGSATSNALNLGGAGAGGGGAVSLVTAEEGKKGTTTKSFTGGAAGTGGMGGVIIEIPANEPPTKPGSISYSNPIANKPIVLTCGTSTDPDGDVVSYVWERKIDSGSFAQIAKTTVSTFTDTVPNTGNTYQVRVKATDPNGGESAYATGSALTISHNSDPTISGQDNTLGTVVSPIQYTYSVNDDDVDQMITVTESVISPQGSFEIRTFTATRNTTYTADISTVWLKVEGVCQLRILADDGNGGTCTRTVSFTRISSRIAASRCFETDNIVRKVMLAIYPTEREADAVLTLEVSNNPYDAKPVWEDITDKANAKVHEFANTSVQTPGLGYRLAITKGSSETMLERVLVKYA